MRTALGTGVILMAISAASCSGSPKYTVDDVVLSDVPLSQKEAMLAAQGEMNRATEERNKAQADVAVDDRDVSVAASEYAQTRLEGRKVGADVRLAERGKDLNRIDAAQGESAPVDLDRRTGEAKLNWLKGRRDFHRTLVQVAELHQTAAERRYELEKARLAQATGKRPGKRFGVGSFEEQAAQAQLRYDEARFRADRQALEARQREQAYLQMTQPTHL